MIAPTTKVISVQVVGKFVTRPFTSANSVLSARNSLFEVGPQSGELLGRLGPLRNELLRRLGSKRGKLLGRFRPLRGKLLCGLGSQRAEFVYRLRPECADFLRRLDALGGELRGEVAPKGDKIYRRRQLRQLPFDFGESIPRHRV